ncbi:hypothetical protein [Phytoactinopolyspora halotolerans]|uniref:hypothetical protein n=1 Tax=Phytoactinopolyspora halotolerans TaxID=1981512 RepID=UPI001C20795D|nr:hypothetical protein [Phytoactinopolyspora halotolerans]
MTRQSDPEQENARTTETAATGSIGASDPAAGPGTSSSNGDGSAYAGTSGFGGTVSRAGSAVRRWWLPEIPFARVAIMRAVIYLFLLYDIFYLRNDVIPHGHSPELYEPLWIGRVLPLPEPSVGLAQTLQVLIVVGSLVAATGRLPRLAGWTVAICYFEWLILSMSFGKVDHDHLALIIAVFALPTIGRARLTDDGASPAAGWAFRCIQVSVIFTYFGSALAKWVRNGAPFAWANGAVLTWAFIRRATDLARWSLDYPWLLRIAQWVMLTAEFLSPIVLFVKGKLLYLGAGFFLTFHLVTYLTLGIHFLPTVVCWLAFFPTEKLLPDRFRRASAPQPAEATA